MKKNKTLFISIGASVILLAGVIGVAVLFSSGKQNAKRQTSTYKITAQPDTLFSGTVQAEETDNYLNDPSKGTLSKINVKDGQFVKAGDPLLTYQATNADLTTLTFAVQTAQNALDNANGDVSDTTNQMTQIKKQYDQTTDDTEKSTLADQYNTLNQTLSQQERAVKTSQLGLSQAQTQLNQAQNGQTIIVQSKQDGIVQVSSAPAEGQPIVSVISNSRIVIGSVTEFDYNKLKVGDKVSITSLNGNQKETGLITTISQIPNSTASTGSTEGSSVVSYNFTVIPNASFQYGYTVQIGLANKDIIIPKSAVKNGQVKVKVGDKFESRAIELEASRGQYKVLSGLKIGETIAKDWGSSQ